MLLFEGCSLIKSFEIYSILTYEIPSFFIQLGFTPFFPHNSNTLRMSRSQQSADLFRSVGIHSSTICPSSSSYQDVQHVTVLKLTLFQYITLVTGCTVNRSSFCIFMYIQALLSPCFSGQILFHVLLNYSVSMFHKHMRRLESKHRFDLYTIRKNSSHFIRPQFSDMISPLVFIKVDVTPDNLSTHVLHNFRFGKVCSDAYFQE